VHTHKGFTDVYETLVVGNQRLADYLAGKNAIVTGHSLGAALANLLVAELGTDCAYGCTFEGPRVGDAEFVAWMDRRVLLYRYVIIGDVVPHAPPENLGYFHAGIEIDLDPAGVIPLTLDPKVYLESHHQLVNVQAILNAP
jgi:predicted lipase